MVSSPLRVAIAIARSVRPALGNAGSRHGSPRQLGCVVLADDPVAADATCARLMGLEPDRVPHIHEAAKFLGNSSPDLVEQMGEVARQPEVPFRVVPEFRFLHSAG